MLRVMPPGGGGRSSLHGSLPGGGRSMALCAPGGAAPGCAFAVATMASAPSLPELELFVRTLARFDGSRPLYVAVDAAAGAWLRAQTFMAAVALDVLEKYGPRGRDGLKRQKHRNATDPWLALQLEKTTVMEAALDAGHAGVLFADADVIWLSPLPAMGPEATGPAPGRSSEGPPASPAATSFSTPPAT